MSDTKNQEAGEEIEPGGGADPSGRMEEVEGIEKMVPLPHEGGFPPVPSLEQMEEDECGDPADETMHRQTSISTQRDQFEGPDLPAD